jgi:hypothetical protein
MYVLSDGAQGGLALFFLSTEASHARYKAEMNAKIQLNRHLFLNTVCMYACMYVCMYVQYVCMYVLRKYELPKNETL